MIYIFKNSVFQKYQSCSSLFRLKITLVGITIKHIWNICWEGISNILFPLHTTSWQHTNILLCFKYFARIFDLSIVFPTCENTLRTYSLKKASSWMFCDILHMCYNIIQIWIMGTILNPAIFMFVNLKYQTWIIL